jgi:hypothetical protein
MLEGMKIDIRQSDLEAYLDEALPAEEMVAIEQVLRADRNLSVRLSSIHARRNAGVHSVGEIWRSHRLSCSTKEQLGSFLLQALPEQIADYIAFHLEVVGCRYCLANLADLKAQQKEDREIIQLRRRKYFQSSAGYLRRGK